MPELVFDMGASIRDIPAGIFFSVNSIRDTNSIIPDNPEVSVPTLNNSTRDISPAVLSLPGKKTKYYPLNKGDVPQSCLY